MLYWIVVILLIIPMFIFYPTKVIGRKNIIKTKSIIACNHQTLLDVPILATKFRIRMYALAKKELFENKILGWFFKTIGAISIDRNNVDLPAIKNVLTVLKKKNKPILIFPSGTRHATVEESENIKNGVAMFALKADCPILPVVFIKKPKIFRRNKMVIGEPLDLSKFKDVKPTKEVYAEINQLLSDTMRELINKYGE